MTATRGATRVADADAFLARAGPFLAAHEAEHNLALGLLGRLRVEPRLYGFDPDLRGRGGRGLRRRLPAADAAARRRAEPLRVARGRGSRSPRRCSTCTPALPGAVGPNDVVARFAAAWSRLTGVEARIATRQRVHAAVGRARCSSGAGPDAGGGAGRHPDRPRLARGRSPTRRSARRRTSRTPRRPTGAGRPTPTVPGSCGTTAALSRSRPTAPPRRPAPGSAPSTRRPSTAGAGTRPRSWPSSPRSGSRRGLAFCFLFTDLANPTSNAIYARIGYEPVADWDQWAFEPDRGVERPALAARAR